jgi:hypothetical protein
MLFAVEILSKLRLVRCINDAVGAENNYKAGADITMALIGKRYL